MEEMYDGLVVYDTDFDIFARKVGEEIEKSPPKNVKVIRYTGKKNYPGFKSLPYDNMNPFEEFVNDFIIREGDEKYDQLRKNDYEYDKKNITPWFKEKVKQYSAHYVISLHSTPRDIQNQMDVKLGNLCLNMKMRKLLHQYQINENPILFEGGNENFYKRLLKERFGIAELTEKPSLLNQTTTIRNLWVSPYPRTGYYHYISLEFFQDPRDLIFDKAYLGDGILIVDHLCEYLNTNYVK